MTLALGLAAGAVWIVALWKLTSPPRPARPDDRPDYVSGAWLANYRRSGDA